MPVAEYSELEVVRYGPVEAAGHTSPIALASYNRLLLVLKGTYTGPVEFQATLTFPPEDFEPPEGAPGIVWFPIGLRPAASTGSLVSGLTWPGGDAVEGYCAPMDVLAIGGLRLWIGGTGGDFVVLARKENL